MADKFTIISPIADYVVNGLFKEVYTGIPGRAPYEHPGTDFVRKNSALTLGTAVRAVAGGTLITHRPGDGWGGGTFGVCRVIDHTDTPYWSIVAHLADETFAIPDGPITQGQVIGHIGMTGLTTGAHCHLGFERGPGGGGFDPARFPAADGVDRIGSTRLLDPLAYMVDVPGAPPAAVTLEDLDHTLDGLNAVVIANIAADKAQQAAIDALTASSARIEGILADILNALTRPR